MSVTSRTSYARDPGVDECDALRNSAHPGWSGAGVPPRTDRGQHPVDAGAAIAATAAPREVRRRPESRLRRPVEPRCAQQPAAPAGAGSAVRGTNPAVAAVAAAGPHYGV